MKKLLVTTAASLYFGAAAYSAAVWGDDTEIYLTDVAESASAAQPNLLFIFDTSASMLDDVSTLEEYDPLTDYGASSETAYYFYEQDYTFIRSIAASDVNCQALPDTISSQPNNPVFNDRVAHWFDFGWMDVGASSTIGPANPVECAADSGAHGADNGSAAVYAANGSDGPYNANAGTEITWTDRSPLIVVSANYHDYLNDPSVVSFRPKIDVMRDAAKDLVDDFDGFNIGIMRFNDDAGGYVVQHFDDITPAANKAATKAIIENLPAIDTTPLAETLWEAARYFRGESVEFGLAGPRGSSVPESISGGNYISPITNSCQRNHVVFLTDGAPFQDDERDAQISTITGQTCTHQTYNATLASHTCLDEWAEWMHQNDHSSLEGQQNLTLHTIGFDVNLDLLAVAAQKGGGKIYNAADALQLKAAFNQIVLSILTTESTFAAPAVTVNAYNNLQHRSDLYYAIFRPDTQPRWAGNLKRYRVGSDAVIRDANDAPAIDPSTGFFLDSARSFWSASVDGRSVTEGGFAQEMSTVRNIYTYTSSSAPDNVSLNAPAHLFDPDNTAITNEMLGLDATASASERSTLMDWMMGKDVELANEPNPVHNFIGDPLHSRPVVVTYGGTESNPDDTVYFANNLGALHAVDASDGSEQFAFIPQALLPNGRKYLEDQASVTQKVYGLDGPISIWRRENASDADATIESGEGDHVYLYVAMRRGGGNYYALDLTDRSNPKLLWRVNGGAGDYVDLAQSWSAPTLAKVKWSCDSSGENCTDKTVVLFGGGYDTVHDTATAETTTDGGAAVYMVDAVTGDLLWSAGKPAAPAVHDLELSDMENSMAADLTPVDIDGDGFIDILFGVDVTGHVWRFDLSAATNAGNFATGGIIARLGDYDSNGDNDAENFRRFYNAPDVALFAPRGEQAFYTISLASGYRAHPLDTTVTDRVYTIFDPNVFDPPQNSSGNVDYSMLDASDNDPLDEGDLFDATNTLADRKSDAPHGWFKTLDGADEKGLSKSTTFGGALIFTTYLPPGAVSTINCTGDIGSGRAYVLDALTGGGLLPATEYVSTEYITLEHAGIPPAATIIFTDDSETYTDFQGVTQTNRRTKPIVCIGTECFDDLIPGNDPLVRTFWREN